MNINNKLYDKDTGITRKMQGKRMLANFSACKIELKNELKTLFSIFEKSVERTNSDLQKFPINSRSRGFEATLFQTNFAELLLRNFPGNAFFGKGKRLTLTIKGYVIFFKKLDKKGLPMNIKTKKVEGINNQYISLDLFSNTDYNDAPLLYFGYQKDKLGDYVNPQIVYIDEDRITFTIETNHVGFVPNLFSHHSDEGEKGQVKFKNKEEDKIVNYK